MLVSFCQLDTKKRDYQLKNCCPLTVVLSYIRKPAEQAMEIKTVSSPSVTSASVPASSRLPFHLSYKVK